MPNARLLNTLTRDQTRYSCDPHQFSLAAGLIQNPRYRQAVTNCTVAAQRPLRTRCWDNLEQSKASHHDLTLPRSQLQANRSVQAPNRGQEGTQSSQNDLKAKQRITCVGENTWYAVRVPPNDPSHDRVQSIQQEYMLLGYLATSFLAGQCV